MKYSFLSLLLALAACNSQPDAIVSESRDDYPDDPQAFSDYWYAGQAELASYNLVQNRYGEERQGNAVLIFVTEPFSESKQVKLDNPNSQEAVTVMKLNFTRNFVTGIYPYSMMMSVFTPVSHNQYPSTMKVTMSSQEWCGNTFTQLNLDASGYRATRLSYFESEGDSYNAILKGVPEDEIWNRIRIDPDLLPVGEFRAIPGTFFTRFSHTEDLVVDAQGQIVKGDSLSTYQMDYPGTGRGLSVVFDSNIPHRIISWKETMNGELMSSGELKKVLVTDYWNKNASRFEYLRDSLELR